MTTSLRPALRALIDLAARPVADARLLRALDAAAVRAGDVVVEVGCGRGLAAATVQRERGVRVVGVDVVRRAVVAARRSGVTAVVGDALELPFRDASCDVVVCEDALSSVVSPTRAVAEMARVLRSGGHLVMTDVVAELDLPRSHPRVDRALRRLLSPRTVAEHLDLLAQARLEPITHEASADDVVALATALRDRLRLLTLLPGVASFRAVAAQAADAAMQGSLAYLTVVARKPATPTAD